MGRRFERGFGTLCVIVLSCLGVCTRAKASATLLLEEPYSYDGAFAGTGHVAVYLDHVCAESPVKLRPCAPGESGVVVSRYNEVAGYDWIAIPLVPYLYAVEQWEDVPLFADTRLVAFLRDQYRRNHLEKLVPDRGDGAPGGDWYELVGSSYDRTIYAFQIETSPQQDARLIDLLNSRPNRRRYSFVKRNCADFAREIINFYYPHALHRSMIGDLGVTTPKQIAKTLVQYGRHHPELETSDFIIPQTPGTLRRSKPVHGVLESVLAAKKYMAPLIVLHPYISGSLLAAYFSHGRFNPARDALILDSSSRLRLPITNDDRRLCQSRLTELTRASSATQEGDWPMLQGRAEPALDASGRPVEKIALGTVVEQVGIARANVLSDPESSALAVKLVTTRLRQELRRDSARRTPLSDAENDLKLLQNLLAAQHQAGEITVSVSNLGQPHEAAEGP